MMMTTQDLVMSAIRHELTRYKLMLIVNPSFSNQGTMYAVTDTAGQRHNCSERLHLDPVGVTLTYAFDMPERVEFGNGGTKPVVAWIPKRSAHHHQWVTDSFDQLVNIVVMQLRG